MSKKIKKAKLQQLIDLVQYGEVGGVKVPGTETYIHTTEQVIEFLKDVAKGKIPIE